jgi:hypothetical protein
VGVDAVEQVSLRARHVTLSFVQVEVAERPGTFMQPASLVTPLPPPPSASPNSPRTGVGTSMKLVMTRGKKGPPVSFQCDGEYEYALSPGDRME